MEFDVFTTTVVLQDIPSYTTSIILEGQLLTLTLLWNERIGKRVLSIKNSNDEYYLQNTILHPNESFELNSNAVFDDLPYKVILQKVGDLKKVGNIYNWSKDFILCFYRTVDIETEKLNVKYGVTAPSTPTLPKPFGNWILNQGYELVNEDIKYTAYNTNGVSYYDSFADFDLVTTLVRSFHDSDLQQYAAFKTAVDQLTNNSDWVLDPTNNTVQYSQEADPNKFNSQYLYYVTYADRTAYSPPAACSLLLPMINMSGSPNVYSFKSASQTDCVVSRTDKTTGETLPDVGFGMSKRSNPDYNPSAPTTEKKSIPMAEVATQVISNAESNADEILRMLSEDYINIVANSVFDVNASKQFVKLEDLIPQLEANKVLR